MAASIEPAATPGEREALILAEYEGLKIDEIAAAVQCDRLVKSLHPSPARICARRSPVTLPIRRYIRMNPCMTTN